MAAQKMKIKNKIPARLYIYFPDGEISNKKPYTNNTPLLLLLVVNSTFIEGNLIWQTPIIYNINPLSAIGKYTYHWKFDLFMVLDP